MRRRSHSGQALVVMLAFLGVLTGAFILVFNVGQTVNDKMKLVNAADAAAYSAALWEARSLNYQAYLNRAIVANEVAIGQLVSLRSWSTYMQRTTRNVNLVAQWVPPLTVPMRLLAQSWKAVDTGIQRGLPPLEAAISHWNVDVLQNAQGIAFQQTLISAANLVSAVARGNEPRAQVTEATRVLQVRNGAQWQDQFTARYQRGGGDLRRFTDLLMASRDGFTRSRRGDLLPAASPVQVSRRGGTDLIGEYSWRGVDTVSAHIDLVVTNQEIPIGWGAAEQRHSPITRRGVHGGSLRTNPRASRLAQRQLIAQQQYAGVPEIRDVVRPGTRDSRSLLYTVALQLPRESMLTADRLFMPAGLQQMHGDSISVAPNLAADALHALGTAELYFQRPFARSDGRREYPSLFSPYWQARLADTPSSARTLTAPLRGLAVDPFAVLP
ncbi:MAG: pilus assembly protein TadG-related protein [Pseudomonadota bacterium]